MPAFDCRVPATGVELDSRMGLVLVEKPTVTLQARVIPDNSTDEVSWSSDTPSVATVDENGTLTAVAKGQATITATVNGYSATCLVTVAPMGAIPGLFSVSGGNKVYFSKGNMYWNGNSYRFESRQYDYRVHYSYPSTSPDYNKTAFINGVEQATPANTVGTFVWVKYGHSIDPYQWNVTSFTGSSSDVLFTNATTTTANTSFTVNGESGVWRSLSGGQGTSGEWAYLLNVDNAETGARDKSWARFAKATVHGAQGLLVFPDGLPVSSDNKTTINGVEVTEVNIKMATAFPEIADAGWSSLESAGVVFLPCVGYRNGETVKGVGDYGYYWSSSVFSTLAYPLLFYSGRLYPANSSYGRYLGCPIRLVCH